MSRVAGVIAAVVLGLVACGDGDDEVEPIDPAADEDVIEDAALTIDDLPEGWEVTEPDDDDDERAILATCLGEAGFDIADAEDAIVVEGERSDFSLLTDDALGGITAWITSFADDEVPRQELEAFTDDAFVDCIVADAEADAADSEEGDLVVEDIEAEVSDPPVEGDDAALVRMRFTTEGAVSVAEQHLLLVGRFVIALQVLSIGEEPDGDLVEDLLETMADRVDDAAGD